MTKLLDEALSVEISTRIDSQATKCFDNAYQAALAIEGTIYVQGFLVVSEIPDKAIEYSWIELGDRIIDPTFPHLGLKAENLYYFPAQSLSIKQITAIIEESKEDYPLDATGVLRGRGTGDRNRRACAREIRSAGLCQARDRPQ